MVLLSLAFGILVGLSLGLTGGGGSILAVPLLVYGLGINPREAVGISLAAVGGTALAGAVHRIARKEVDIRTGFMFAAAGMLGAPAGSWLGRRIPDVTLLISFAALMIFIAIRMWRKATTRPGDAAVVRSATLPPMPESGGAVCRFDPTGRIKLTSRCALVMSALGVLTGVLSGLFGVGGGFVIVPALVMVTGMGIHRAVATSLLVIALISGTGVASHLASGMTLNFQVTLLFVIGGLGGMWAGTYVGRRLSPVGLQKVFAVVIVAVAVFVVIRSTG